MKTGVLWLGGDGECSNGVVNPRHVHGLDAVWHCEQHVRAGHPHSRRALPAETLQGGHQPINVGLDLRLIEGDGLVSGLVGRGIRHEGVAAWAEGEGGALKMSG